MADHLHRLSSNGPCNKLTYRTKKKAVKALDIVRSTEVGRSSSLYECPQCGFFHLTSQRNE